MAELTAFSFHPGTSLLHKLDVRFKLLFLILISLVSLAGGFTGLGILTGLVTALIIHSRLPLKSGFNELRLFMVFLLLILAARMFTIEGTADIASVQRQIDELFPGAGVTVTSTTGHQHQWFRLSLVEGYEEGGAGSKPSWVRDGLSEVTVAVPVENDQVHIESGSPSSPQTVSIVSTARFRDDPFVDVILNYPVP